MIMGEERDLGVFDTKKNVMRHLKKERRSLL